MSERHLVLVGLMGAGKTTVGRRCAKRLGRSFVDLDDLIMTHAAMSIEEIWRERGEERFRAMEREVVVDVCASPVPLVIACGWGHGGRCREPPPPARSRYRRVAARAHRRAGGARRQRRTPPLLMGDPAGALARLAETRADAYAAAADVVVDTDGRHVKAVAAAVLDAFAEHA